jgi:HSP20 family protein
MAMTQLTRRSTPNTLRNLQREVDDIFNQFFGRRSEDDSPSALWAPSTDLVETDDAYRMHLDVPGMSKEDIEINIRNRTLTVSGERTRTHSEEAEDYVRTERAFGRFHRSFTLPDAVDPNNIEAHYDNGVLQISVPKTETAARRQIEIK